MDRYRRVSRELTQAGLSGTTFCVASKNGIYMGLFDFKSY
jgi:hypothetical protein